MKKVLDVIKKGLAWVIAILKGEEFTFVFPLAIFALIAFVKWSFLFVVITAIWSAHIILRTHEEK
jgi:hypothetical protein